MTADLGRHNLHTILDEHTIQAAIERMAREIVRNLPSNIEIVVIGVLEGARPFATDLTRNLRGIGVVRGLTIEQDWIKVSSYQGGLVASGAVEIVQMPQSDLRGRHVIVADDIIDQGHTLTKIAECLESFQPATFTTCVLLDKPVPMKRAIKPNYTGLPVPNAFIVGYGLDYQENYRNLPYLASLSFDANENEGFGLADR